MMEAKEWTEINGMERESTDPAPRRVTLKDFQSGNKQFANYNYKNGEKGGCC